jgi:hypothetical protein
MSANRRIPFAIALLVLLPAMLASGLPTENHEIYAVPAPGRVVVDGNLDEWDLSGRIFCCPDVDTLAGTANATVAMMYDAEALYVAVDWLDSTPMLNNYDPRFEQQECFKSDMVQIMFRTDLARNLFCWYFTRDQAAAVVAMDGAASRNPDPIVYSDAIRELGVTEAFQKKRNGDGYVQEIRIPWTTIAKRGNPLKAWDGFDCMLDLVWGSNTGRGTPLAHCIDLVKPGAQRNGDFWEVGNIHGKVMLASSGNLKLPPPSYVKNRSVVRGTLPVRVTIPKSATRFTVAINDANGLRVRNLIGDGDPLEYEIETNKKSGALRVVEVGWDCLDEHGRLVKPGVYDVRALTHEGLGATYEMSYYNPGTPPWPTSDGTGGWGGDNGPPRLLAAAGDWMIIGWEGGRNGAGLIAFDRGGAKRWGEERGALAIAGDEKYVYFARDDPQDRQPSVARISRLSGAFEPFPSSGKPCFPTPLQSILGTTKVVGAVTGMAVNSNQLVIALSDGRIALLDAETASLVKTIPAAKPQGLAFSKHGRLYALLDGKVNVVDLNAGSLTPVDLPGVGQVTAIAVDNDANIVVADCGPDCQVKAFSPNGEPLYTCGRKGGRAICGAFDKDGMRAMSSIAVDKKNRIWVTESSEYPRRVSIWRADGTLFRDYVGAGTYAGAGAYLSDDDPTLGYYGPCEFSLNHKRRTWNISKILWVPDAAKNEFFPILPSPVGARMFKSSASGTSLSYLYSHDGPQVVYMERHGRWQPVAAICQVYQLSGGIEWEDASGRKDTPPSGQFAGMNLRDGLLWTDKNKDGQLTLDECVVVKADPDRKDGHGPLPRLRIGDRWGGRPGSDLCIFAEGLTGYRPIGFTDDGAPIYGMEGIINYGVKDSGDLVPITDENRLLVLSDQGRGNLDWLRCVDTRTGTMLWEYPSHFSGLQDSFTVPAPGTITSAIKILGTAFINDKIGSVLAVRGNLGQDYFLTSDGLYVGALFPDVRTSEESIPGHSEKGIAGMQMGKISEGRDQFNGWFGKQKDGIVRLVNAMVRNSATILDIHGLDSIRKVQGPRLVVDDVLRVKAEQDNATRGVIPARVRPYTIKPLKSPTIDGKDAEWRFIPAMSIGREGDAEKGWARLAYDDTNLYVLFRVIDSSPWQNEGKDYRMLFKTGDALDIQMNVNPTTPYSRSGLLPSDVRIIVARLGDRPVAVLMKPMDSGAEAGKGGTYESPICNTHFDRVEIIPDARVSVRVEGNEYCMEAAISLKSIGLMPQPGMVIRGDVGIISSDAQGRKNVARTYWSNKLANIVSDVPTESWLYPATWGEWRFE